MGKMFWEIKKDLKSLFTRNENSNRFDPIDGLRSIANINIILLHLMSIYSAFISPENVHEWNNYLNSLVFALNTLMSFSLEIFFMISSFLLTNKLLTQWNRQCPNVKTYFLKEYPLSIVRRVFRLWPGLILSSLILLIFGEPRYPNSGFLFELFRHLNIWMFFQNYVNTEYWYITFIPLWSISIDMQIHIILPPFIYLFNLIKDWISMNKSLFILLIISIIRGIIVFNPVTMPVASLIYKYPSLTLLSPDHLMGWLKNNYNLTYSFDLPDSNIGKMFMHQMYLPLEARFGSFIIGSILSVQIFQSYHQNPSNKKLKSLKKMIYFLLICFYLLTLIQSPVMPPSPPSDFVIKVLMGCSRQLFTIGQSFVLFSALCPCSHPYHSPWIKKFLSLPIWIPISKLSYFVYLIHWRISFQLIFNGYLQFLKRFSITYATLISLPIVLLITEVLSSIWFVLADKPIERAIRFYLFTSPTRKNHLI